MKNEYRHIKHYKLFNILFSEDLNNYIVFKFNKSKSGYEYRKEYKTIASCIRFIERHAK